MKPLVLAPLLLALACPPAMAQNDWRGIVMQALNSPSGSAEVVLTGPLAEKTKAGLKTDADILLRVSTVATLPQPGCKRMEVLMYIPGKKFPTTDGGEHEFRSGFQLNVCPDGRPPESSHAR